MDVSSSESTPTRQGKQGSSGRGALPRRATRGPLDLSQAPVSGTPSPIDPTLLSPPLVSRARSHSPNKLSRSSTPSSSTSPKDFSKLLRPEIYHPLPQLDIPISFRQSSTQPSPNTPLAALLSRGHFRAAAILAAHLLTTSTSPTDTSTIFSLLHTRFASLTLCNATTLAAQEVKVLEDLNAPLYRSELTGAHLVPWDLRVLAVRLQGMGFNDARRAIMGYYDLARDARTELSKLKSEGRMTDDEERLIWEARLKDLGVRVASALVEMEDFDGAARHLASLRPTAGDEKVGMAMALLYLRLGDLEGATKSVAGFEDAEGVVVALSLMGYGKYKDAVEKWRELRAADPENEMLAQNSAVCLLYAGRMDEGRQILEGLVEEGRSFHTLTFNLCTIYELCSDRSRSMKSKLAEKVATLPDNDGTGWEKTNVDFKL